MDKEYRTTKGEPITSKEQALKLLCNTANWHCLPIEDLFCYKDICKQWNITSADYYNDVEELSQAYLDNAGDNNYKPITEPKGVKNSK
jgi:hypothetical protein